MLKNLKKKAKKTIDTVTKVGENILGCTPLEKEVELNISSEPSENIKTIMDCPYLEEKCADLVCPCPKYFAAQEVKKPGTIENTIKELGIDPSLDAWTVMMSMQKIFAGRFHNTENLSKDEKDHWINDYLGCITDELSELLTAPNNIGMINGDYELKKEVIDIAHFVMDVFIAGGYSAEDIKNQYIKTYIPVVTNISDLINFAYTFQKVSLLDVEIESDWREKYVANMIIAIAKVKQQISWKHWKKKNKTIDNDKLLVANIQLFKAFMDLVAITMDDTELKNIYIEKNVENILRQKFQY